MLYNLINDNDHIELELASVSELDLRHEGFENPREEMELTFCLCSHKEEGVGHRV